MSLVRLKEERRPWEKCRPREEKMEMKRKKKVRRG